MDKLKQWVALTVVAALAIGAGGWFLLISPKRSSAADLRSQAEAKQQANSMLMTQLSVLKAQAKDLPKKQATLAAVAAKIPSTPAMPALVRALTAAADDANVELVSMAPGAPAAVVSTSAPATPTAAAAPAATTGGTLQQIPVTLNVVGSYFAVAQYLDHLENLERAFRVTGFALTPGQNPVKPSASQPSTDSGKTLTAAITGLVFDTTGGASSPTPAK